MPEQPVIGIRAQAGPADDAQIAGLAQQDLQIGVPFNDVELNVNTDLLELLLGDGHDLLADGITGIGGRFQLEGCALVRVQAAVAFADAIAVLIGPTGLLQQRYGLLLIECAWLQLVVVGPGHGRYHVGVEWDALSQQDFVDDGLAVEAIGDGLAHALVAQDGVRVLRDDVAVLIPTRLRVLRVG